MTPAATILSVNIAFTYIASGVITTFVKNLIMNYPTIPAAARRAFPLPFLIRAFFTIRE